VKNRKIGTHIIFVFPLEHWYPIRMELANELIKAKMVCVPIFSKDWVVLPISKWVVLRIGFSNPR
jgi:hypothetical protein